jgi:hypothetical protein
MLDKIKKHITERNLVYLLISILVITTLIDIFTAVSSPIFEIGETNPIYLLFGKNVFFLILVSTIATIWIIKKLNKSLSVTHIFIFTLITIYLSTGHLVGAYSNISATQAYEENPEKTTKLINSITPKEKIVYYQIIVLTFMIYPYVTAMAAFSITLYFFNKRKPEREKIVDNICKLTVKLQK